MTGLLPWLTVAAALLGAGGLTGVLLIAPQYLKLRAEARKTNTEAEVVARSSDDDHLQAVIEAQTLHLLEPLERRVHKLEQDLAASQRLARQAIQFIRVLLGWINRHLGDVPVPVPDPPADIANEL